MKIGKFLLFLSQVAIKLKSSVLNNILKPSKKVGWRTKKMDGIP